jgi:glutamate formiminotransferase/formiminotetrahydrofolate cyclodeaminase
MIDADTSAYNDYMEALGMPRESDADKADRRAAMQAALKSAIQVPLNTMKLGDQAWPPLIEAAGSVSMALASDVQVGARCLETGIWGAWQNVKINMLEITDPAFKKEILDAAEAIAKRAAQQCQAVLGVLDKRRQSSG